MTDGIARVLAAYVVGIAAVFGSILSGVPWRTQVIVMLAAFGILILAMNRDARAVVQRAAAFNAWAERAAALAERVHVIVIGSSPASSDDSSPASSDDRSAQCVQCAGESQHSITAAQASAAKQLGPASQASAAQSR
jgi:hypothetical protein